MGERSSMLTVAHLSSLAGPKCRVTVPKIYEWSLTKVLAMSVVPRTIVI